MHAVVVSYLEWIRWVATGWFRCADRVIQVPKLIDDAAMSCLMARAPDLAPDDNAFLIARVDFRRCRSDRELVGGRGLGDVWLGLEAVESFHPMSERGARLLAADAERASVKLGEPISELQWLRWRNQQDELESHWRGNSLCRALGLAAPELPEANDSGAESLRAYDVTDRARRVEGSRMFGWSVALAIAGRYPGLDQRIEHLRATPGTAETFRSLISESDIEKPFLAVGDLLKSKFDEIQIDLDDHGYEGIRLSVMATIAHYQYFRKFPGKFPLDSFLSDIEEIGFQNLHDASIAAYYVGRSMESAAVSKLSYISNPGEFRSISAEPVTTELDIEVRVQKRRDDMERASEHTGPNETADQYGHPNGEEAVVERKRGASPNDAVSSQTPGLEKEQASYECSVDDEAITGISPEASDPAVMEALSPTRDVGGTEVDYQQSEMPGFSRSETDPHDDSAGPPTQDDVNQGIPAGPRRKRTARRASDVQPDLISGEGVKPSD